MSLSLTSLLESTDIDRALLEERLNLACSWLCDCAQVKSHDDPVAKRHRQLSWTGAIKGEYAAATRTWSFFCPVWHTGQAVKALTMAYQVTGNQAWLDGAARGAAFIANNTLPTATPGESVILAYEDHPDKLNTSAVLECLDGLRLLDQVKPGPYGELFLQGAQWVTNRAWLRGEGLFQDLYDPATLTFIPKAYAGQIGRPLLDDGTLLHAFRRNGNPDCRNAFFETADRLLRDEFPEGNWINYSPCSRTRGVIHPRHAYWWGYPMFMAYAESGERKYLDCALRACRWYARAQRRDGGLLRGTYLDFSTDSFGHATSGIAAAMTMFLQAMQMTGSDEFREPLRKALQFCLNMQFTRPADPNLRGAILEKVLPPDGTDRNPYHIRDLGTIFFAQAAAALLALDA